jgi:OOP family OmpA-OmpF porin
MFVTPGVRLLLLGLVLVVAAGSVTFAEDDHPLHRVEIGVMGGFILPDKDLSNKDSTLEGVEPTGGLRLGVNFARHFDWFVDGTVADSNANVAAGDVEARSARTGIGFYFPRPHGKKVQWFVNLGVGRVNYNLELLPNFDRTFATVALGQRVRLDKRSSFRWELRSGRAFDGGSSDPPEVAGQDIQITQGLISINWGLGRSARDSDKDGVIDPRDDCPDTPQGAIVDERGCPIDSDGDGVWDGIDRCPNTPRGAIVDEWGCPSDSDGDGVWDGIDQCPNTPRGTPVREDGCPKAVPLFTPEKNQLILEGVFFEFDKAVLMPVSRDTLDVVGQSLIDWPKVRVEVQGHTDSQGDVQYNEDLSMRRAQAVKDYLVSRGVSADRMTVTGFGESRPIADNSTMEGRAKNRRVQLQKLE